MRLTPLILCGGAGTRLWPSSNDSSPKQLLSLGSEETLLQSTLKRVSGDPFEAPILVTAEKLGDQVEQQLSRAQVEPARIILEPEPRNTAPAIGLAVFTELAAQRDPLLLAMPSDHLIRNQSRFVAAVAAGVEAAQSGEIVTFGIRPRWSETGYGYIEAEAGDGDVRGVLHFVEKPDAATAQCYLDGGRHFWNAGIFLFRASVMAKQLRQYSRAVASACEAAASNCATSGPFTLPGREQFLACASISIDYAVMEKSDSVSMVEADLEWSDVGSWDSVWEICDKDSNHNVVSGEVTMLNSSGCLIRNETDSPVAVIDCHDLNIIVSPAGSLIVPRGSSQKTGFAAQAHPGKPK